MHLLAEFPKEHLSAKRTLQEITVNGHISLADEAITKDSKIDLYTCEV